MIYCLKACSHHAHSSNAAHLPLNNNQSINIIKPSYL